MKLGHLFCGVGFSCAVVGAVVACNGQAATGSSPGCQDLVSALNAFGAACGSVGDTSRSLEECEDLESAPGIPSSFDSAASACANTLKSAVSTCGQNGTFQGQLCALPAGTLADGAACGSDEQCQSDYCLVSSTTVTTELDGGGSETESVAASACGVCTATIPTGQPCDLSNAGTRCAGSGPTTGDGFCNLSGTGSAGVCAVPQYSALGGACGTEVNQCNQGLRCDETTQKCVALSAAGGACSFSSDCTYPLICANSVCAAGAAAGQPCTLGQNTGASSCQPTLGCDLTTNLCTAPNQDVAPGGTCDGQTHFCAKGSCVTSDSSPTGTCPTIIPDGQPCSATSDFGTSQCDDGSVCINSVCVFPNPSLCK